MTAAPDILIVRHQPLKECELLYRDDPEAFAWDILGVRGLFPKMREFLHAVAHHRKVTCRGAYGTGKTFWTAVLVLWFLFTRYKSRVVTTAPRERQVKDLLWAEINALYLHCTFKLGGKCLSDRLDVGPKWFAVGMTANQKNESTMQGYHGHHVLFVGDESSGLRPSTFEIADRLCVGSDDKQLFIGNAIDPLSTFAATFKDPTFHKLKITAFDTPNVQARRTLIPGMATWEWAEDKRIKWGEHSQLYKSRVLADFPSAADNAVIPLAWIEAAMQRWETQIEAVRAADPRRSLAEAAQLIAERTEGVAALGADIAGGGDDETIVARRKGPFHLPLEAWPGNTQEIAGRLAIEHRRGYSIAVDAIGIGAGVADAAAESGVPVVKVIGSQASTCKDPTGTFGFTNLRGELYWTLREQLNPEQAQPHALPRDELLLEELAVPTFKAVVGGKIQVEPKDKVKERLGRSPDRADATVYSTAAENRAPAYAPPEPPEAKTTRRHATRRRW